MAMIRDWRRVSPSRIPTTLASSCVIRYKIYGITTGCVCRNIISPFLAWANSVVGLEPGNSSYLSRSLTWWHRNQAGIVLVFREKLPGHDSRRHMLTLYHQALIDMMESNDTSIKANLASICGILFFGVPN